MNWRELTIEGEPRLVVARRGASGRLAASRLPLHQDTFDPLQAIASSALGVVRARDRRMYAPFGELDPGEYFSLNIEDVPIRRVDQRRRDPEPEVASALRLVSEADDHPLMTAQQLADAPLVVYAIVFDIPGAGFVGFLRKASPKQALKPGVRFFQFGDTLRTANTPDLVLDGAVDVIVAPDEVAILNSLAFRSAFSDVHSALIEVGPNVERLEGFLVDFGLPLSQAASDSLLAAGARRVRHAQRIKYLADQRLDELLLQVDEVRASLQRHNLEDMLVDGQLSFPVERVGEFLDWIDGRLFHDDHTGEARKADRYSRR